MNFGGIDTLRSTAKTALAFAAYTGLEIDNFPTPIEFMKTGDKDDCVLFYSGEELIGEKDPHAPLHCVSIYCDSKTKQAFCYVEYFSIYRLIIKLSNSYNGVDVSESYAVNPLNGETVAPNVNLNRLSANLETLDVLADSTDLQKRVSAFMRATYKRNQEAELNRVLTNAMQTAAQDMGIQPGDTINPEQAREFSEKFTSAMLPYLEHLMRPMSRPTDNEEETSP